MNHRSNGSSAPAARPRHLPRTVRIDSAKPSSHENPSTGAWEPLLTNEEAGALLRVHPKTLDRNARLYQRTGGKKGIPGYFYLHRWHYRLSELDGWLRTAVKSA